MFKIGDRVILKDSKMNQETFTTNIKDLLKIIFTVKRIRDQIELIEVDPVINFDHNVWSMERFELAYKIEFNNKLEEIISADTFENNIADEQTVC